MGDRHLDNLLLTKSGNLFHIDFGYILGRDPKPFPPPMKLSREMVEGMGGVNSEHYQQFKKLCYTAFLHLRRHANLILNLFTLMVDATIPDIALEPDKTVKKVQDKFRLELSDEEAVHHIQTLIEVSATAVMASLVEQVHKFAQVSSLLTVVSVSLFFSFHPLVLEKVMSDTCTGNNDNANKYTFEHVTASAPARRFVDCDPEKDGSSAEVRPGLGIGNPIS